MADRGEREEQRLGNYRLVRLLGRGGFAEVYLGEHVHLNTLAAVKLLRTNLVNDELEKFRNEARTIARLEHPSIVRVLDFGVEDDVPFLIMNYAPNGTLRQHHPRGSQLPLSTILTYVRQIADALQYAHDEKLIHRDIKPENMLLGRRNEILLSDFGLAAIAQSAHSMSKMDVAGTVTYMAPEQLQGKPTAASDQYALAVVIYEWLSGDYPFHGLAIETAIQHMLIRPIPLHEKIPNVPSAVEQVVLRALEKEPYKRFESMQAFAHALEQSSTRTEHHLIPIPNSVVKTSLPTEESFNTVSLTDSPATNNPTTDSPANTPARLMVSSSAPIGTVLSTYRGHAAAVMALGWSPDGQHIVSGSNDQSAQVWRIQTTDKILTYRGHASWVHAVAWSLEETKIASGSWDNTVQIWDTVTGNTLLTYRGHTKNVNAVAWSPNNTHIASGGYDQTVQVWDASTGGHSHTYSGHSSAVNCVAWFSNGKRIASGSLDQTVQVWDPTTGGHVFTYSGHAGGVHTVAWSPNGKRIASGGKDATVQIWGESKASNVFTKSKVTTYRGHASTVHVLDWSSDGKYIASGDRDGTIHIWETTTGNTIFTYRNHTKQVNAVAWSPDGRFIASASDDKTVQVWFAI
jgi:eukaryotic-like serine/threonine-protein kinase